MLGMLLDLVGIDKNFSFAASKASIRKMTWFAALQAVLTLAASIIGFMAIDRLPAKRKSDKNNQIYLGVMSTVSVLLVLLAIAVTFRFNISLIKSAD